MNAETASSGSLAVALPQRKGFRVTQQGLSVLQELEQCFTLWLGSSVYHVWVPADANLRAESRAQVQSQA